MKLDPTRAYRVVLGSQYDEASRFVLNPDECKSRGIDVSVRSLETDKGAVEARLRIANNSDSEVSEIIFPDLELEPLEGGSGFTMPVGPGWRQGFDVLDEGESITWNYPVYGSMQWVDYGNKTRGTYIGVHDKVPLIKLWTIGKRRGRPWIRVRFTDLQLMPGETYELPPLVIWQHTGGWHEGAKLYRAWAQTWMEKPQGANWYDEAPAWCWSGFLGQHSRKPSKTFADAPAGALARSRFGVKLTNAGGWTEHGHDAHYPDYYAGSLMGGAEGLVRAVDEIHQLGLRISLYTNGRIADPCGSLGGMPGWKEWAVHAPSEAAIVPMQELHANFRPAANRRADWGSAVVETYGKVDFAVMCPGCPEWRELLISRLEAAARDYRADGTFIDQVCGAWAYPCYSKAHDHARPNEAWSGYITLLKELRARLRAVNPEFQMSTEGVCDIFGQFFDVQQGHNDWDTQVGTKAQPCPELYSYTFPWYVVNTGHASPNNYYYLKLAHAVGSGLDLCDLVSDRCEEGFLQLVKQIMSWRRDYADVLRRGEFIGALECDSPHYLAHCFRLGSRVVITAAWVPYKCSPERPSEVVLRIPNTTVRRAGILTESGTGDVSVSVEGADSLLAVPVTEVAVIEGER